MAGISQGHTPTNRPIVKRVQHGTYNDSGVEADATRVDKEPIRYIATLRLLQAA
jgi:hypothetical protein